MKKILVVLLIVLGLASLSWGQVTKVVSKTYTVTSTTTTNPFGAAGYSVWTISWVKSGTVSACTIQMESSATFAGAYAALGAAQTCTSSGSYTFEGTSNAFARLNATAFTGTGTVIVTMYATAPIVAQGPALVLTCGATSGSVACGNVYPAAPAHFIYGNATLAANTATISGIVPAFTSTSTFFCVGNDVTTRANPVQVVPASASSITITNTTGATDVIQYMCVGY